MLFTAKIIQERILSLCPILYQSYLKRKNNMFCECDDEHMSIIEKVSYELEMLNMMFYEKYRVRIQMDKIKEEFGELNFYNSIIVDHGKIITYILNKLEKLEDILLDIDYGKIKIQDIEPSDYDRIEMITKEEYDKNVTNNNKYVKFNIENKNGINVYSKITRVHNFGSFHFVPTKNKFLYVIKFIVGKIIPYIDNISISSNEDMKLITEYMRIKSDEIIKKNRIIRNDI